jgi:hypothetical protein
MFIPRNNMMYIKNTHHSDVSNCRLLFGLNSEWNWCKISRKKSDQWCAVLNFKPRLYGLHFWLGHFFKAVTLPLFIRSVCPFSLWVIHKEGLCPSSAGINMLMMMMMIPTHWSERIVYYLFLRRWPLLHCWTKVLRQ